MGLVGRDLDTLVAVRVMGLDVEVCPKVWSYDDWQCSDYPTEENRPGIVNRQFRPGGMSPPALVIPHYSLSESAAWEVVEKLSPSRLLGLSEFFVGGDPNNRAWRAIFSSTEGRAPLHAKAEAPTAPHAICLAALEAVGASPNESRVSEESGNG